MRRWLNNPRHLRHVHLLAAVVWIMPGIPVGHWISYELDPRHGVFAILLVSYFANFYTAISAWQAARAEEGSRGKTASTSVAERPRSIDN